MRRAGRDPGAPRQLISTGSDCWADKAHRFERTRLCDRIVAPKGGPGASKDGLGDGVELDPVYVVVVGDAESRVRIDGHYLASIVTPELDGVAAANPGVRHNNLSLGADEFELITPRMLKSDVELRQATTWRA